MPSREVKQFGIFVKEGLLDEKHRAAIGEAIWLYLWILNAVTKVDGDIGYVFGGAPVSIHQVEEKMGKMSRMSYWRHIERLEKAGYISTKRAMRGLIIIVTKSYKIFGDVTETVHHKASDVPNMVHHTHSDVPQMSSDVPNMVHLLDKTIDKTNNKEKYKKEIADFLKSYNDLAQTKYSAITDTLRNNYCAWRETYSLEEILRAVQLALEDPWWKDKVSPEKLLRRHHDHMGELLNKNQVVKPKWR